MGTDHEWDDILSRKLIFEKDCEGELFPTFPE